MVKNKIVVLNIFLVIACIAIFFIWKKGNQEEVVVEKVEDEQTLYEQQQVQYNVGGIVSHVFDPLDIPQESFMEERDFEGEQKKWIVVNVHDRSNWDALEDGERQKIIEGLITTSRLQGDREFGGLQILHGEEMIVKGWWRAGSGYVII